MCSVSRLRLRSGFSLIELMVVVVIIAIISALVLPAMGQATRERHVQQASINILDAFRQIRSRAMYRGRAQILTVTQAGTGLVIDAYEGDTNSCRQSTFGAGGTLTPSLQSVLTLDLTTSFYTRDNINAVIALPVGLAFLEVCYTPTGNAFFATTLTTLPAQAANWSNDPTGTGLSASGAFEIDLYQALAGSLSGMRRRVLIPVGGLPRLRTAS